MKCCTNIFETMYVRLRIICIRITFVYVYKQCYDESLRLLLRIISNMSSTTKFHKSILSIKIIKKLTVKVMR